MLLNTVTILEPNTVTYSPRKQLHRHSI